MMMAGMRRSPNTRTGEALGRGFRDFPNTEAVAVQGRYRCCERAGAGPTQPCPGVRGKGSHRAATKGATDGPGAGGCWVCGSRDGAEVVRANRHRRIAGKNYPLGGEQAKNQQFAICNFLVLINLKNITVLEEFCWKIVTSTENVLAFS